MSGILYIVAVPIGNPDDLTIRALRIFREVDIIACENTKKFLDLKHRAGFETSARLMAYYSYNEQQSSDGLIAKLKEGNNIAMVSAAGTPRVSDPGYHLVRKAHENEITVKAVPGVSGITAAMSIAPLPLEPFLYLGFISPKPGRRTNTLAKYNEFSGTICLYESVHRLIKLLEGIKDLWGNVEIFIARELTKQHEDYYWGNIEDGILWAMNKRGEFIIFIHKK